ncbi:unnamed protein product [Diatraea saccharalis]|uniref:RIIa domain-containing protein n=1 Tax=Diatraea saccharalis TaxID=40085 RepID=A0A9N9R4E4_9NEOP|nr:unnamed protein product [Diatraea saccharalis]
MTLSGSAAYSRRVPVPKMPPGLVEIMEGLTKDVLKHNPPDVYEFCANHVLKLLEIRDGPSRLKTIPLDQRIKRAQEVIRKRTEQRWQANNDTKLSYTNDKVPQKVLNPVHHDNDLTNSSEIEISCQPGDTICAIEYLQETKPIKDDDKKERSVNDQAENSEEGQDKKIVEVEKHNSEKTDFNEKVIFVENSKDTETLQSQENGILEVMETKQDHFENPSKIEQHEAPVAQNITEKDTEISVHRDLEAVTKSKNKVILKENTDETMNNTNNFETNIENDNNLKEATMTNQTQESGEEKIEIVPKFENQSTKFDTLSKDTVAEQKNEKQEINANLSALLKVPNITINEQQHEQNTTNTESNVNLSTLEKSGIDENIPAPNLDKADSNKNALRFEEENQNKEAAVLIVEVDQKKAKSTLTLETLNQQVPDMKDVSLEENPKEDVTVLNKILEGDQKKDASSLSLTELKKDMSVLPVLSVVEVDQIKEMAVPTIAGVDQNKNVNVVNLQLQHEVCAEDIPLDVETTDHNIRPDIVLEDKEQLKELVNKKSTSPPQNNNKEDDLNTAENYNDNKKNLVNHLEKDLKQKTDDIFNNAQVVQDPKGDIVIETLHNSSDDLPKTGVYIETSMLDKNSTVVSSNESTHISKNDTSQENKIIDDNLQSNVNSIIQSDVKESIRPKRDIEHVTVKSIETVQENNTDNIIDFPSTPDDCGTEESSSINSIVENGTLDGFEESAPNDNVNTMDLETAAVTIQKVFRTFLFKSRASTFEDSNNDINTSDDDKDHDNKDMRPFQTSSINKDRRNLGISRMDTVLQTVNEEKSLSLSTDDSSLSSAATIIQAHVRGFLVRNKLNSGKTASSTNSLINSDGPSTTSIEGEGDQHKNKTILNIHIVPEGNNYLSRDESIITSMDLSLDGSPPSSVNLHPLGYDKSERRKQLKREDAIQSVSPPSNNSGKLSDDIESVKELPSNSGSLANTSLDHDTVTAVLSEDNINVVSKIDSNHTTPENNTVESLEKLNEEISISPEPVLEVSDKVRNTLTKQSSDETDVVTPYKGNTPRDSDTSSRLLHSGEFHDTVLPTKVSRSDTPVVSGE